MRPRLHTRLVLLIALILVTAVSSQTLLEIRPASAFKPPIHKDITGDALGNISKTVGGETIKFSQRAIKQVKADNAATDAGAVSGSGPFFDSFRHFDNELFATSSKHIVDLKKDIINKITANSPDGRGARKDLGSALHAIQDFYSHSNWVELVDAGVKTGINQDLGRIMMANPAVNFQPCPTDAGTLAGAGLQQLTSGYYFGRFGRDDAKLPAGKCYHGLKSVLITDYAGINKDDNTASPTGHPKARDFAKQASADFVKQILDDPSVDGNAKAVKALMDVKGTLGMIIDDTGSMGNDIAQVKTQVAQIVGSVAGTPDEPDQYLLVRFGDPNVGNAFVTGDANQFLNAVNAITASGGGDCPEFSQNGLLRGIAASSSNSTLFLFTDASSKDSSLASSVNAAAQAKGITLTPILTGTCSPIDPAYIRNAEETGGQLFFLNRPEVSKIFDLVRPQLSGDFVSIVSAKGAISPPDTRDFEVPVDSNLTTLVVSVTIDSKDTISLLRPSGAVVAAGDSDATITDLSTGRIITIDKPEAGEWQVHISGSGNFALAANGNSSLAFFNYEFVELSEPPHAGFFSIVGQPVLGKVHTALADLVGPFSKADFRLVNGVGDTIQAVTLTQGNPDAASDEFVGMLNLPVEPFRVAVRGMDTTGQTFERLFPTLFRIQSVDISVDSTVPSVSPGTTTTIGFSVRNLGAPSTFRMTVADNRGFISRVAPTLLTLGTDESGIVNFDVSVPTGTPDGTDIQITATATDTSDSSVTNSTTLGLVVVGNLPPIADAGLDQTLEWTAGGAVVTLDASGSSDPDDDPLTYTWTGPFIEGGGTITGVSPTVTLPFLGLHTITLVVNDGTVDSAPDAVDITVLGPRDLKQAAIDKLSGHADESKRIGKAVDDIQNSLDSKFWVDDLHLVSGGGNDDDDGSVSGKKVFDHERKAVKELQGLLKDQGDDDGEESRKDVSAEAREWAQMAIDDLVRADRIITMVKILDAETAETLDPKRQDKVEKELTRAKAELTKGDEDAEAGKPDDAIQHYRKAWEHAVKAMKEQMRLPGEEDKDDEHEDDDGEEDAD